MPFAECGAMSQGYIGYHLQQAISEELKNNNIDKLKYLYYECFNKNEESIIKIYEILTNYINTIPSELYNLLMLPYMVNKS